MVDVADPLEEYSAARYAREAAAAIRDITARGKLPIVVGGTGFYYRALTRGLFPGRAATRPCAPGSRRSRAGAGSERLHRWLGRVDPASAARVMPRDLKRIVRASRSTC
jgi:tRNA dimethylallyltransferase